MAEELLLQRRTNRHMVAVGIAILAVVAGSCEEAVAI